MTEPGDLVRLPATRSVQRAVAAIAAGGMVVVVDDADREDEGDLILAAATVTTEQVAFVVRHTTGILCAPIVLGDLAATGDSERGALVRVHSECLTGDILGCPSIHAATAPARRSSPTWASAGSG